LVRAGLERTRANSVDGARRAFAQAIEQVLQAA
jgi:hypothetical protein